MNKIPSRWLTDEEQKLWRSFLGAQFRLAKVLNEDLENNSGFDHLTYEIFVNLSESEDRSMRMTQLAKSVSANKSRLTYRVEQLEKAGLVQRELCESDGRGHICRMTEKGYEALVKAAPSHVQTVLENFIEPIDAKDVEKLIEILDSIAPGVQTLPHLKK